MAQSYKDAGVNIELGDQLVSWLKSDHSPSPHSDKILSGIGGFAALFKADFRNMKDPYLVACTDGVGTKVKLAAEYDRLECVAQDLVAMCVNDLICCGGEPLFFLDYYATGKLVPEQAQKFLTSVKSACAESLCALIGGETAEMPGVYANKDFDAAGFCVGVVDRENILSMENAKPGHVLVAVESNGFHSNGYSLLRKVFAEDLDQWVDTLMRPTHLYVKLAQALKKLEGAVIGLTHVTGGGVDNLLRGLPSDLAISLEAWELPAEFLEVKRRVQMTWTELLQTLNGGIGLAICVEPDKVDEVIAMAQDFNFKAWKWGQVVAAEVSEVNIDIEKMDELNGK